MNNVGLISTLLTVMRQNMHGSTDLTERKRNEKKSDINKFGRFISFPIFFLKEMYGVRNKQFNTEIPKTYYKVSQRFSSTTVYYCRNTAV